MDKYMEISERKYVNKRKRQAFLNSLRYVCCRIFPIKKNRIAVCTFEGRSGFCCNPKYIVQELHRRNPEYEFVWLVNDIKKEFPDYVKKVKNTPWNSAYWLSTSKVWIDNYRKTYGTRKRKGQFYINTWHGTIGFKTIGLYRGNKFSSVAYLVSKSDSDMIDYVTVDSEWCLEFFPKGLIYNGKYLNKGAARCDTLYGDKSIYRQNFREKRHIDEETKIVMFAPTFREKSVDGRRVVFAELCSLDFEKLLECLKEKFGGEWKLCIRFHPQLVECMKQDNDISLISDILDVSKEEDLYEILPAMDMVITDYSSLAMDASFGKIPVFIFAEDIERYIKDRGSFLWNMETRKKGYILNNKEMTPNIDVELPFSVSENNTELQKNIMDFDVREYERKLEKFNKAVSLVFDGKASEHIADKVEELIRKR